MKKMDSQFQLNGGAEKELTESKSEKWAVNKCLEFSSAKRDLAPTTTKIKPNNKNIKTQRAQSVSRLPFKADFISSYFTYLFYLFIFYT